MQCSYTLSQPPFPFLLYIYIMCNIVTHIFYSELIYKICKFLSQNGQFCMYRRRGSFRVLNFRAFYFRHLATWRKQAWFTSVNIAWSVVGWPQRVSCYLLAVREVMSAGDDDVALSFGDSSTTSTKIRYLLHDGCWVCFKQSKQLIPTIILIVQASDRSFLPSLFPRFCANSLHLRVLLAQRLCRTIHCHHPAPCIRFLGHKERDWAFAGRPEMVEQG